MSLLPISIASYSFHGMVHAGDMNAFQYIETIVSRYRVHNADIWSGLLQSTDVDYVKRLRAAMDRNSVTLANLCVDGPFLWEPEADKREANRLQMLEYIRVAEILGAKTIRIDFGGHEGEMTEEAFEYIVERYQEYCDICEDLGMKIGPENHWGWDNDLTNLIKVWRAVDHPAYGHLLHVKDTENFLGNYQELLPNVMHTHIPANSIPFVKEFIRNLANADYAGTLSIEHHSSQLELERVEWQLASVRAICAELEAEGLDQPAQDAYITTLYKN